MSYHLRYHPLVADDLVTISELIEDYAGPRVARRKLAEIAEVAQSLRTLPHIGNPSRSHLA